MFFMMETRKLMQMRVFVHIDSFKGSEYKEDRSYLSKVNTLLCVRLTTEHSEMDPGHIYL